MNPWFIWKDRTSQSMGLWISKLPDIIRPAERVQKVKVPGRAGELTLLEGDEVYDGYPRTITVTLPNENYTEELLNWLRGEGDLIVCTEDQMVYKARIETEVVFSRVGNCLLQGKIPFYCSPFKMERYPATLTAAIGSTVIKNIGNAISKPLITTYLHGATTIAIGDKAISFERAPENLTIDCEAGIILTKAVYYNGDRYYYNGDYALYSGGQTYAEGLYRFTSEGYGSGSSWEYVGEIDENFIYPWPGAWSGEFPEFLPGENTVTVTTTSPVTDPIIIEPRWRWV